MPVLDLQNVDISLTLIKFDSITKLSQQFWSFSEQTKETLAVESVFGIFIGAWIGQLEFLKGTLLKTFFFINFQNFCNIKFSKVLSKLY